MNEYVNNTASDNITVILDAAEHYLRCEPKLRQMCVIWLNGTEEAYSMAFNCFLTHVAAGGDHADIMLQNNLAEIFQYDWTKINHCTKYISSIVTMFLEQLLPALYTQQIHVAGLRLGAVKENSLYDWSFGSVLLKFNYPVRAPSYVPDSYRGFDVSM